jgi:hypothetical protein
VWEAGRVSSFHHSPGASTLRDRGGPTMATLVLSLCRMLLRFALAVTASACVAAGGADPQDPTDAPDDPSPRLATCRGRAFQPALLEGWRHSIATPIVTAGGAANHMGRDLIVKASAGAALAAKFTYGVVSKDLEDEDVRVFLDDCSGWVELGDFTTDSDGQIHVPLTRMLPIGIYELVFQVLGDASLTTATLHVLPAGTRIALTDIDGTLTASDSELFQQMLDGSHVPVAYAGAVELTRAHAERGHVVLYMTGRPDWLSAKTRTWLGELGFAAGPVRVTDSNTQILPTEGSVGAFKQSVIEKLSADYEIEFAYGNASTDVDAYLAAGLPADRVWIIGTHAGEQGTNRAQTWTARAAEVRALPRVQQPFEL